MQILTAIKSHSQKLVLCAQLHHAWGTDGEEFEGHGLSGEGGDGLTVGLDDFGGLFQPQ